MVVVPAGPQRDRAEEFAVRPAPDADGGDGDAVPRVLGDERPVVVLLDVPRHAVGENDDVLGFARRGAHLAERLLHRL